jgi:hypothetical protein
MSSICRDANEIAASMMDEGDEHELDEALENGDGETETGVEEADVTDGEGESASTFPSFAVASNSQLLSTQTEYEGDTSTEDHIRSSTKRSQSQSPKIRRPKRKPGHREVVAVSNRVAFIYTPTSISSSSHNSSRYPTVEYGSCVIYWLVRAPPASKRAAALIVP